MPITISHPAVAVPLKRCGLVMSALVVGSMMPDFEFFLRLSDGRVIGHTVPGIFLFCVPVGLVVLLVFHKLVKVPLLSMLPHSHQVKLYPVAKQFRILPLKRFFMILFSLAVGAFTHLGLDSLTHYDGWMVQLFPVLRSPVFVLPQGTIRVYFILQYVCSLAGIILMLYWYFRWYYQAESSRHIAPHRFHFRGKIGIAFSICSFTVIGGLSYGFFSISHFNSEGTVKTFVTHTTIAAVSSFILAILTFGILWHYFIPHHRRIRHLSSSGQVPAAQNENAT